MAEDILLKLKDSKLLKNLPITASQPSLLVRVWMRQWFEVAIPE